MGGYTEVLKGNLVGLTAVERSEIQQLMIWRNNAQLRKFFREYRELNSEMQEKWFQKIVNNNHHSIMLSIRRLSDDELLGCCGLCYINWIHRHAELSLYIGYDNAYIDNHGYADESCILLLEYGFKELGLNKVSTEIYEFDTHKEALLKKLNFHLDGILRKNYFYEKKWWDSKIYSILSSEKVNGITK
jgi:RimJ/RimL family protein N-acetyltransferase